MTLIKKYPKKTINYSDIHISSIKYLPIGDIIKTSLIIIYLWYASKIFLKVRYNQNVFEWHIYSN